MFTHEHELRYIRVLVDEVVAAPYRELSADHPYPVGATLVKLEYDDGACTELGAQCHPEAACGVLRGGQRLAMGRA